MIKENGTNLNSKYVIVDNEISNDISTPKGDWNYELADITVVGVLYENKIIQIYNDGNPTMFREEIKLILSKLPQPFHALNKNMEHGNFLGFLDEHYEIEEIKPFLGRGWSKNRFFTELIGMGLIQEPVPGDPFKGDSRLAIDEWKKGNIQAVLDHNTNCLYKEYHILMNKDAIIEKYKDKIDSRGWIK